MGDGRRTVTRPAVAVPRPYRVAVIGGADASEDQYETARILGSELAALGAVVLCGGHGGVMEGAARGVAEAGGTAIGILRGSDPADANPWIALPLPTGMGEARNALVVSAAEAVIAVGGEWGTLSEIALARKMGLPVGVVGEPPAQGLGLTRLSTPAEAALWGVGKARFGRGEGPVTE